MDATIGIHFNEWDPNKKLSYLENTLAGNARIAWEAFKSTPGYPAFMTKFTSLNRQGSLMGDFSRMEICGISNKTSEQNRVKREA